MIARRWVLALGLIAAACNASQLVTVPPPTVAVAPPIVARVVRGKVSGADGQPVLFGHARFLGLRKKVAVELASDGTFSLTLPERRVVTLEITGIDHRRQTILLATEQTPLFVEVRLGTYAPIADPTTAAVVVMRGRERVTREPMKRGDDGKLRADLKLDDGDYTYEIDGAVVDGGVVGHGARYEYDGNGDYLAPLHVTGGHASVVYDLAQRPARSESMVNVGEPGSLERRVAELGAQIERANKHDPSVFAGGPEGYAAHMEEARKPFLVVAQDMNPLVRQIATIAYFGFWTGHKPNAEERAIAKRFVAEVPPDDVVWSVAQGGAAGLLRAAEDPAATASLIEKSKDDGLVADLLLSELHQAKDDIPRARALVAKLKEPRFDHTPAQGLASWSDPDRVIAPRKKMPDFELPAISGDGLKGTISTKSFGDKTYLVEIWATWCAPCVAGLPKLHEVFARYGTRKGKHLDILSVSVDDGPATVAKFRAEKAHPMPWNNAYLKDGDAFFKNTLGFEKGGLGVPFYILVDHGMIVEASPTLEPNGLPALLDRLFESSTDHGN